MPSRRATEAGRCSSPHTLVLGLVGESLRYVAESECGWLALLSWSSASWKSRHREAFVGWDERSKQQRLRFVVNNGRFLILPWVRVPHLASCILAANVRRLSGDWVDRYGHPILLVETFVDLGSDFAVRATEQPTGSILAVPEEWDARVRDTRRMANRRGCLFWVQMLFGAINHATNPSCGSGDDLLVSTLGAV